ncbi:FtsX-like permease family protein [Maribacter algarum]|uniref:FtsX-like permease family protein n=1 Tax=Maribacter algarum (ex Zhang et al. 2020) TaxID=2578118 RepID=A0A5S3Q5V1_9FLAO|nr:ABC transporter permease [Maribacter algarum]TMM52141.1 FtsX-like permease family protein [Maribacter algarum]
MYKLFLKIATRYLLKNKLYSFINIFGLAIGIASFVLIMLYVNHEKSYDKFEGSENVHRLYMDYLEGGEWVEGDANAYIVSAPTLKEEFPEVLDFVRLRHMNGVVLMRDNIVFDENKGSLSDPSYFEIFDRELEKGDVNQALSEPYSIVLTKSLAKKIFGSEVPMGKSLKVFDNDSPAFTVTGILEDDLRNTHIKNDFLISFKTFYTWKSFEGDWDYTWNQNIYFTYLQLDPLADANLLKKKIMDFKVDGLQFERHNIEPLEDIHLYSDKPYEAESNGSASRINFLLAIALIIIVLSWLNYVNLSTAKSLERAKETGIRKVAGAQKPQIVLQSLLESLLLNLVAITIAIFIVVMVLPIFSSYVDKTLSLGFVSVKEFLPMAGFILFGTVLSGIYPAFILSGYSPARALKGKIRTSRSGITIRKTLIMGQFLATIVLLISTIIVTKQIKFLQDQPIGADLNQVVALSGQVLNTMPDSLFAGKLKTFKNELEKFPFVESTAGARTYPGGGYDDLNSSVGITFPDGRRDEKRITYNYSVDPNYFELMNMEFVAGEPFKVNSKGNSNQIVMNEKFVRFMGISKMEEAVNKTVKFFNSDWVISGVVKDYHHFGLKTDIEPMLLRYESNGDNLLVKLNQSNLSTANISNAISQIESKWKEIFPKSTFNYTFLDQNFEAQYNEDRAFGSAFQIFTIMAILIASMGLFGLTSYSCIQRKKEIGVRKVNGASIIQILSLLNVDFVKWVGIAFIIAIPISWFAMNKWLEGFAYKTAMSWWVFALAGATALVIALITVSWQSFRAAVTNPVESLRDE